MQPRAFFDEYVTPALDEWRGDPSSVRHVVALLCQLDIIAEHVITHLDPSIARKDIAPARAALVARQPMLQLAGDIHDTHKHGSLTDAKKVRKITGGQQPQVTTVGGFGRGSFGSGAYGAQSRK